MKGQDISNNKRQKQQTKQQLIQRCQDLVKKQKQSQQYSRHLKLEIQRICSQSNNLLIQISSNRNRQLSLPQMIKQVNKQLKLAKQRNSQLQYKIQKQIIRSQQQDQRILKYATILQKKSKTLQNQQKKLNLLQNKLKKQHQLQQQMINQLQQYYGQQYNSVQPFYSCREPQFTQFNTKSKQQGHILQQLQLKQLQMNQELKKLSNQKQFQIRKTTNLKVKIGQVQSSIDKINTNLQYKKPINTQNQEISTSRSLIKQSHNSQQIQMKLRLQNLKKKRQQIVANIKLFQQNILQYSSIIGQIKQINQEQQRIGQQQYRVIKKIQLTSIQQTKTINNATKQ